jgi:hypothetical protein
MALAHTDQTPSPTTPPVSPATERARALGLRLQLEDRSHRLRVPGRPVGGHRGHPLLLQRLRSARLPGVTPAPGGGGVAGA